jgi:phospholipid/cholesterol/gamma-HCH transport system ATP-binding protein
VKAKAIKDRLPAEISTGMKRSVAIARALAAQPEAVLYDEPTTMVDPLMARTLGNLIDELEYRVKLTGVVVTHDTRLMRKVADHVVFLDHAKVIFFGTVAEMERSSSPIVRQFLELDGLDFRAFLALMEVSQ